MTGAPLEPVALPAPDLKTLTDKWQECLVLPAHPSIPPGTRLWHRKTADGYLACCVVRTAGLYQVQLVHKTVGQLGDLIELNALEGRPPTIAELTDALARFTAPGALFALFLVAPQAPGERWQNPVHVGCSEIPAQAAPPDMAATGPVGRGRRH